MKAEVQAKVAAEQDNEDMVLRKIRAQVRGKGLPVFYELLSATLLSLLS